MYLAFDEYKALGGTLDEPTFNQLLIKAEIKFNYLIDHRLDNDTSFPKEVKYCIYEIISLLYQSSSYTNPDSGIVSGFSNDGISVSFATKTAQEFEDGLEKNIKNVLVENLYKVYNEKGIPLIYRGWK